MPLEMKDLERIEKARILLHIMGFSTDLENDFKKLGPVEYQPLVKPREK